MSLVDAVALVERVRASAAQGARDSLEALAAAVGMPIADIAIRACPVLPPGIGRLNIMRTKEKAAPRASRGTRRASRLRWTFREAHDQRGIITPHSVPYVAGPR